METTTVNPAPVRVDSPYDVVAGFKIDPVRDQAEDLVLDLVDYIAEKNEVSVLRTVTEITRLSADKPAFRDAARQTMSYLQGAYSQPDYSHRPDLNEDVKLEDVEAAGNLLEKALN